MSSRNNPNGDHDDGSHNQDGPVLRWEKLWLWWQCSWFLGLFQGTFRAIGKALAADLTPEALMGTGLGIYSATIGLTGLIASIVGGQLWDRGRSRCDVLERRDIRVHRSGLCGTASLAAT